MTRAPSLAAVAAEAGVAWAERDVDADPELADEYGDRVPVVLLDGSEHGYWRVDESRLRAALGWPTALVKRRNVRNL